MSHRYTSVEISTSQHKIDFNDGLLTMGSCFSDNIGSKLKAHYFNTLVNPLGILYNPISIGRALQNILRKQQIDQKACNQRGEVYFHYDYHSDMSALSADALYQNINNALTTSAAKLKTTNWLIITLGTSVVHKLKESNSVVANCHKMPADLFHKSMLTSDESFTALYEQMQVLPDVNIILTVSPIRHTREGVVQNQRSKSRLIECAHQLTEALPYVSYFPAYELMMDELRDYRYYTTDLIHPSAEAINIIWEKFQWAYLTEAAKQKITAISKYLKSKNHKPQFPESTVNQEFFANLGKQAEQLESQYGIKLS